jgi:hypothetical protein
MPNWTTLSSAWKPSPANRFVFGAVAMSSDKARAPTPLAKAVNPTWFRNTPNWPEKDPVQAA